MADLQCEVCVLGGGPAGAVIARQLAGLGHNVVLIERALKEKCQRVESLAPSILPLLESLQLGDVVDAAVLHREKRAMILWGSRGIEVKRLDEAPSLIIDRALLDGPSAACRGEAQRRTNLRTCRCSRGSASARRRVAPCNRVIWRCNDDLEPISR